MRRIWVTRAFPGAEATAARLRAMGWDPVSAPLLEVRPTATEPPDLTGVGSIAFSSVNGVAAFAELSPVRDLATYAVGDATAAAARALGFGRVLSADGDVAAVARLILGDPGRPAGAVLHICPLEPAGDLAGALATGGIEARRGPLYGTFAVEELPLAAESAWRSGALAGVLVHSPKAARTLADLALTHRHLTGMTAYVLSEACAVPLRERGFVLPLVAASPREEALLSLLPE